VKIGDYLGIEGNTGYSFGNHCHFEVRDRAGNSLNPAGFLYIPNAVGTYGEDWREAVQERVGL
jgi:murein DD-endopeptidase MepM/ murein hydrolase activator NlpD